MKKFAVSRLRQQEKVNAYFQSRSSYWKDIYSSEGVAGKIYRERQAAALDWVKSLSLALDSRVLEIGCGAGLMAIALAQYGLRVQAIDSTEAMVELARRHIMKSGTAEQLTVDLGDVYTLPFEDESFELVIAIGVIPWLERPELAMREMARVTKPGGHVLLTADNRARLTNFFDPCYNPLLKPLEPVVKGALEWLGLRRWSSNVPGATFHSRRFIDEALARAGLLKTRGRTLGFGPFSFLYRSVLPEALGIALHHWLQHLADRGVPGVRSIGAHYLVLGTKSGLGPVIQSTSAESMKALLPGKGGSLHERQ